MLRAAVLGGRAAAVAHLSAVVGAALVIVDEGADLVLADAALPEADPVRVRGDEEALAGEAAALQAVLKTERWGMIGLFCRVSKLSILGYFQMKSMYVAWEYH